MKEGLISLYVFIICSLFGIYYFLNDKYDTLYININNNLNNINYQDEKKNLESKYDDLLVKINNITNEEINEYKTKDFL